jgi:hypothetical protein
MDSVTYIGQVTWFTAIFGLYALVRVSDVLPMFDRILKVRAKKLAHTRGDARQFDQERTQAEDAYGRSLAGAAASSVGLLRACHETQSAWASEAVTALRQGEGSDRALAHAECLEGRVETAASSRVLAHEMASVELEDDEITNDESVDWIDE